MVCLSTPHFSLCEKGNDMDMLLFLFIVVLVLIVVKIGAIVFELTGIDPTIAQFQALSCYTSTGFTTKESEIVTATPQRRKIASVLMILGHVGIISLIATLANTLGDDSRVPTLLDKIIPGHLVPWANFVILFAAVCILYKIFAASKLSQKLSNYIKGHFVKRNIFKPISFEELSISESGFGICQIEIWEDSPILGSTVEQISKRHEDSKILMIGKKGKAMHPPSSDTKIDLGDRILCFGKLSEMRKRMHKNP